MSADGLLDRVAWGDVWRFEAAVRGGDFGETPWYAIGSASASSKPFPFSVRTWRIAGPRCRRTSRSTLTIRPTSWPS